MLRVVIALSLVASSAPAFVYDYDGTMALVSATGEPCQHALSASRYRSRVAVAGPTGRVVVVNFREPTGVGGFLDNVSFSGNLGPNNDYYLPKNATVKEIAWEMLLDGIFGFDFHLAKISLTARRNGQVLCTGTAEYSGFR